MSTGEQRGTSGEMTVEERLDVVEAALRGVRGDIVMLERVTSNLEDVTEVTLPSGVGWALRAMLTDLDNFRPPYSAADAERDRQSGGAGQ